MPRKTKLHQATTGKVAKMIYTTTQKLIVSAQTTLQREKIIKKEKRKLNTAAANDREQVVVRINRPINLSNKKNSHFKE